MALPRWRKGGFTLLEAVLAMALMTMVFAIGLIFYFNAEDKTVLRKAAIAIESMSSRGHAMSVLHQKPFWLRFEENRVVLVGADVRRAPAEDVDGPPAWRDESQAQQFSETVYDSYEGDAIVSIRRWGTRETDWIRPVEEEFVIWQFQSTGLCEPVAIRLETEKSWMVLHMNPLTARVDEEEMEIQ